MSTDPVTFVDAVAMFLPAVLAVYFYASGDRSISLTLLAIAALLVIQR